MVILPDVLTASIDHAGGLENFKGTDVPIYVHEKELKHAYYSVATKSDIGKISTLSGWQKVI